MSREPAKGQLELALAEAPKKGRKVKDRAGQRYGRWTVLRYAGRPASTSTNALWLCRCDCGTEKVVSSATLHTGRSQSCGCGLGPPRVKTRHGETRTRLHRTWRNMKARCNCPGYDRYDRYGGRGIRVCPAWDESYEAFRDWARANGYRDDLEIDRIDNDGDYCPENCRWVSRREQTRNTSRNVHLTHEGETKLLCDWAVDPRCLVPANVFKCRIQMGWDIEAAFSKPVHKRARPRPRAKPA